MTQIEFSHDDNWLATVSRDRQFALYRRENENAIADYKLCFSAAEAHNRIIWGVNFAHDDKFVVTGARDKKIIIWQINFFNNNNKEDVKIVLEK